MNVALISEKLSAARSLSHFQGEVERYASLLIENRPAYYFRYEASGDRLVRGQVRYEVDSNTQAGKCVLLSEVCRDELPLPEVEGATGTVSIPARRFGELIGVLSLCATPEQAVSDEVQHFLKLVGLMQEQVASREEMKAHQDHSRDLMVAALESLESCPGHVKRVAQLSTEIANLLDLSAQVKADLFEAAHYHDVGLLSLQKSSREKARQAHCQAGAQFLQSTRSLSRLSALVENHHERYDGSGFPNARTADQLPIECWVLSLAEHLEETWQLALLSNFEDKVRHFFAEEAPHHHPEVVDALCGLVDSGRLKRIMES